MSGEEADRRYKGAVKALKDNKEVNTKNKKLILSFLQDCEVGATNSGQIKSRRLLKYIYTLKTLSGMLNKDFNRATKNDIKALIAKIVKTWEGVILAIIVGVVLILIVLNNFIKFDEKCQWEKLGK